MQDRIRRMNTHTHTHHSTWMDTPTYCTQPPHYITRDPRVHTLFTHTHTRYLYTPYSLAAVHFHHDPSNLVGTP